MESKHRTASLRNAILHVLAHDCDPFDGVVLEDLTDLAACYVTADLDSVLEACNELFEDDLVSIADSSSPYALTDLGKAEEGRCRADGCEDGFVVIMADDRRALLAGLPIGTSLHPPCRECGGSGRRS